MGSPQPAFPEQQFFVTGGTMVPNRPSYVIRQADDELLRALRRGEYCYVLETRQVGKSSLVIRTASRLQAEGGVTIATVDLQISGNTVTLEQWCESQLLQIGEAVDQEAEAENFWSEHRRLGPLDRWLTGIRQVILPSTTGLLIIFIDEIDFIRGLPFPTDEYFGGIRGLYNARSTNPELQRLVFCLAGVAVPNELIRNEVLTPFNVARRIELTDFTEEETVQGFAGGFSRPSVVLLKRIWYWTGGHPYLTQMLAEAVAADSSANQTSDVDRICGALFLNPNGRDQNVNLRTVSARLLAPTVERANILGLYRRVLSAKVRDNSANPLSDTLRLSGIVRTVDGHFEVRNPIYRHVFNREWIERNLPADEARRQKEAYTRGWRRAFQIAGFFAVVAGLLFWVIYANSQTKLAEVERKNAVAQRIKAQELRDQAVEGRLAAQKALSGQITAQKETADALKIAREQAAEAKKQAQAAYDSNGQALEALRAKAESDKKAQSAEQRVTTAGLQLADLQRQTILEQDKAKRAAVVAGKLKDLSALRRFSAQAATNDRLTVAGALASIEALGRETSTEAYESLLESLARLPVRMGTVPWKRTAEIRPSGQANECEVRFATLERICRPRATTVFESQNYIVVSPDRDGKRATQPVSNLQYWDVWHQGTFQKLNLAVPPRSALSPSGQYLATPEPDGVVTLREFPSGKEVFRLGSPIREPQAASVSPADQGFRQRNYSRTAAIQFSKDERYLITSLVRPGQFANKGTEYWIWDLEARRSVSWYMGDEGLEFSMSPNRNGARYVWVSNGSICRIPETPKSAKDPAVPLLSLFQTPERSYARFFSEDGSKLMVLLSQPQSAFLYRLPNEIASVFEQLDARTVVLSPDGKLAAFELGDGLVRVFQTDSQREVKRIVGESGGEMRFEDNSHLLTSSDQGTLRWGLSDTEVVATASRDSSLVGFSPEGDAIVTGRGGRFRPSESFSTSVAPDQSFSVFDLASTPPRQVFYGQGPRAFTLQFSADSAVLAAQIDQFPRVTILPLKEKGAAHFISSTSKVLEGITPDVRYAAFGEPADRDRGYRDQELLKTGDVPPLRAALGNETDSLSGFLGFPDNNTVAGCTRGQAYRRDLRNPERAPLSGQNLSVNCDYAGVSADARFVLFRVDASRGVALWNTSDGTFTRLPWSPPPLNTRPTLSLKGKFVFIPQLNEIRKTGSGETVFRGPSPPGLSNQFRAVFAVGEGLAAVGVYPRTSIVNLEKGEERCSIPPESSVTLIGFDANASHLFASQGGRLKAWRTADCEPENLANLSGHIAESGFMSPDGRFLVSTYAYRQAERERVKEQLQVTRLANHETFVLNTDDVVTSTAFSPDGRFLIAGSGDGIARTLDRKSRPAYRDTVAPQIFGGDVTSIAISADSQYAAAAAGASVRVWEIRTGRAIGEVQSTARVLSVSFSHDGKLLALGETDGRVDVLGVPSLASVKELSLPSRLISASFSADGEYLGATRVDGFTIWDSKTWMAVASEPYMYEMAGATFAATGHVYVAYNRNEARMWTDRGISSVKRRYIGSDIFAATMSPDGTRLVVATDRGFEVYVVPEPKTDTLFSEDNDETPLARIGVAARASAIALSPDGSQVAVIYGDGKTRLLHWRRKELIEETCRRLGGAATRWAYEVKDQFDGPYHDYCENTAAIGRAQ